MFKSYFWEKKIFKFYEHNVKKNKIEFLIISYLLEKSIITLKNTDSHSKVRVIRAKGIRSK